MNGWERVARRFVVTGRVQGVGYRAYAARVARALALSGAARNLGDGGVEVFAAGPAHALERFQSALAEGPRQARVDSVETEDLAALPDSPEPFDVEF